MWEDLSRPDAGEDGITDEEHSPVPVYAPASSGKEKEAMAAQLVAKELAVFMSQLAEEKKMRVRTEEMRVQPERKLAAERNASSAVKTVAPAGNAARLTARQRAALANPHWTKLDLPSEDRQEVDHASLHHTPVTHPSHIHAFTHDGPRTWAWRVGEISRYRIM